MYILLANYSLNSESIAYGLRKNDLSSLLTMAFIKFAMLNVKFSSFWKIYKCRIHSSNHKHSVRFLFYSKKLDKTFLHDLKKYLDIDYNTKYLRIDFINLLVCTTGSTNCNKLLFLFSHMPVFGCKVIIICFLLHFLWLYGRWTLCPSLTM